MKSRQEIEIAISKSLCGGTSSLLFNAKEFESQIVL